MMEEEAAREACEDVSVLSNGFYSALSTVYDVAGRVERGESRPTEYAI